jgi:2'-5' RNA ligase
VSAGGKGGARRRREASRRRAPASARRAGANRSAGERVRLFVAVDLPAEVRKSLGAWAADRARELPALRLVPPEALHVTLAFLGWRAASDAGRVGRVALAGAGEVGELGVGEAIWLPARRPRVLAVELDDPDGRLGELQERVSEALAAEAGYRPESRPFRSHVTVARVRRAERVRAAALPDPPRTRFVPPALTLYRSRLSRAGAEYEPLARAEL